MKKLILFLVRIDTLVQKLASYDTVQRRKQKRVTNDLNSIKKSKAQVRDHSHLVFKEKKSAFQN